MGRTESHTVGWGKAPVGKMKKTGRGEVMVRSSEVQGIDLLPWPIWIRGNNFRNFRGEETLVNIAGRKKGQNRHWKKSLLPECGLRAQR